jgi:class 3 adenylate cyclase
MAELPTGTVTFLFTDLEASTRLWEEHPEGMHDALARHDEIVRGAIEAHGGSVVKMTGDARMPRSRLRMRRLWRRSMRSSL